MKNYSHRSANLISALAIAVSLAACGGGQQETSQNKIDIELPSLSLCFDLFQRFRVSEGSSPKS